jgi:hypothetical protein
VTKTLLPLSVWFGGAPQGMGCVFVCYAGIAGP